MVNFNWKDAALKARGMNFGKAGVAALAAATIGIASIAATAPAQARYWHHDDGGAILGGAIGGLALGAAIGSTYAGPRDYYGPPAYVERDLPDCSNFRRVDWYRHMWIDRYGRGHPCD